jgi:hypothetical protein
MIFWDVTKATTMNCVCVNRDGQPCTAKARSKYCKGHGPQVTRNYKKYKRAHTVADQFCPQPGKPTTLLRQYSLLERARNLRQCQKNLLYCSDAGHDHQIQLLSDRLEVCEKDLEKEFRQLPPPQIPVEESEEDIQEDVATPQQSSFIKLPLLPTPATESELYMDQLISENNRVTQANCELLMPCAKSIHSMFGVTQDFDVWFESREAFHLFGLMCLFTTKIIEVTSLCLLLGLPPIPNLPLRIVPVLSNPNANLRDEIARKLSAERITKFTEQFFACSKQLTMLATDLAKNMQPDGQLKQSRLWLRWDKTLRLYRIQY